MTRYHFFNYMFPDQAKDIDDGYAMMPSTIWNAFTKFTHIDRLFVFTPKEFKKDQDEVSGE